MSVAAASKILEYKSRDVAIKTVSRCGNLRLSVANTLNVANTAIQRHSAALVASSREEERVTPPHLRFSEVINFSTLLASFLDQEERVAMHHKTDTGHHLIAESMALGECRAYVSAAALGGEEDAPLMTSLRVDRVLYRQARPVTSVTSMALSELAEYVSERPHYGILSTDAHQQLQLFQNTFTPHAWNFYRKSEGIGAAVFVNSMPSETAPGALAYSTGLIAQPIVADAVAKPLEELQRACFTVSAATAAVRNSSADPSLAAVAASWGNTMLRRALDDRTNVQDLIAFATGDYEGAFAIAERCRLPQSSIESSARAIEPLRKLLGIDVSSSPSPSFAMESAEGVVQRTPIDFFCRCSKVDLLKVLKNCSVEQLQDAQGQPVTCKYCKKDISPAQSEWEELIKSSSR